MKYLPTNRTADDDALLDILDGGHAPKIAADTYVKPYESLYLRMFKGAREKAEDSASTAAGTAGALSQLDPAEYLRKFAVGTGKLATTSFLVALFGLCSSLMPLLPSLATCLLSGSIAGYVLHGRDDNSGGIYTFTYIGFFIAAASLSSIPPVPAQAVLATILIGSGFGLGSFASVLANPSTITSQAKR